MPKFTASQRSTMMVADLWNCANAFEHLCPLYWSKLKVTNNPDVRFCTHCRQQVYQCKTPEDFVRHGEQGHCVSIPEGFGPGYGFTALMGRPSSEDVETHEREKLKVRTWWEAVVALQPDFAAANAAAAYCHENRYMRGGLNQADKEAALHYARAAIEAGADDAATLATAGFVIGLVEHDYETAMNAIDGALALTASSAWALGSGAVILGHAGRTAEAIEYGKRALRVSPLDPEIWHTQVGLAIAHCAAGNWEEAVAACRHTIRANPRFSLPHVLQAAALSFLGRPEEARVIAKRVPELEPGFTVSGFVRAHTGRAEIWEPIGDALRRLGLPE